MPRSAPTKKDPEHPPEEKAAVGRCLAAARGEASFSLQTAADELTRRGHPLKKARIGAWETGQNLIDAIWLRRLARLYNTTTDALVGTASHLTVWPFTIELQQKVLLLRDEELVRAENVLRGFVGLTPISLSDFANSRQLSSSQHSNVPYAVTPEDGAGLPSHIGIEPPASKNHGGSEKIRRPARKAGRGST